MTVEFVLNPESAVPIFRQIADGLRASIARGAIRAGELLPSVRSLAEELGVNPNTVHRAIGELEREGLVEPERGRGMIVRINTLHSARANGEDAVVGRLVDALRYARAVGLDEARLATLLDRARRQLGESPTGSSGEARSTDNVQTGKNQSGNNSDGSST